MSMKNKTEVEQNNKLDNMGKPDFTMMLTKAGLNLIPSVGGTLASLLGDYQTTRNDKRLKEFIQSFSDEMSQRIDSIQREFVKKDDFIDVFLNITDDAMRQRRADKRLQLRNLLINSITLPNTQYEDTEEFERLINILTATHLEILNIFYKDREHKMADAKKDIERIEGAIKSQKINCVFTFSKYYLEYVRDLENQSLVQYYVNNHASRESGVVLIGDQPFITDKGKALIKYITLEEGLPILNN